FDAMVEHQLRFAAERRGRKRTRTATGPRVAGPTATPTLRLPRVFRERPGDIVCVHGEANAWPHGSAERRVWPEELVHWTAERVATGETFARFVKPVHPLAPATLHHLGLA